MAGPYANLRNKPLVLCALAAALAAASASHAAVGLDGTAGPAKTIAGPHYQVNEADGRRAGNNLFHSFSTLTLASGETLTFVGSSSITNVIARVTGGARSQIDGTISFSGMPNANLLLINPAGISFGATGSIDNSTIRQAFTATTADNIQFADGTTMSSTGPLPSLLSTAPPAAFGFVSPHQGTIEVQGALLTVVTGKSLALVSGSVRLKQATTLRATNGRIQLVAVGDSGTAAIDPTSGGNAALTAPPSTGALQLDAGSQVVVNGAGSGRVDLLGQQINVQGNVFARTSGTTGTGFRIDVYAIGDCIIDGQASLAATPSAAAAPMGELITSTNTPIAAGNITIFAGGTLHVANGGLISANTTLNTGLGGQITVNAHDILVDGASPPGNFSAITAQSQLSPGQPPTTGAPGGNISLSANSLTIANRGVVSTVTFTGGNAGNITLKVTNLNINSAGEVLAQTGGIGAGGAIEVTSNAITISGVAGAQTGLIADTTLSSNGAGGQVGVTTQQLNILPLGVISTTTNGSGAGGGIQVTANSIQLSGGGLVAFTGIGANAQSEVTGAGDGGNINVHAPTITVSDGAGIAANTFGPGRGGTVTLGADLLTVDGGRPDPQPTGLSVKSLYSVDALANHPNALPVLGDAGTINVDAGSLVVTRGGGITSAAAGIGNGGSIALTGNSLLVNSGGNISASSAGGGNAGSIQLQYDSVHFSGGLVLASVSGAGKGGDIVMAGTAALLDSGGQVSASSTGSGDAGSIHLGFNSLTISSGQISATTTGAGKGGDIVGTGATFVLDSLGQITASSTGGGKAGSIQLNFDDTQINGGQILASVSGSGDGGNILMAGTTALLDFAGQVSASSTGSGQAGSIHIAFDALHITSAAQVSASTAGAGNGGDIVITGATGLLDSLGEISASGSGSGKAGNINMTFSSLLHLDTGRLQASASGTGAGGDISATAGIIQMTSATVAAASTGAGNAGTITLTTPADFTLLNSSISAAATAANGGNVNLAGNSILAQSSRITAQAAGNGGSINLAAADRVSLLFSILDARAGGDGGNITMDPNYVILHSSQLAADAEFGRGGSILVQTLWYLPSSDTALTVSSQFGVAGNIAIETPNPLVSTTLAPLIVQVPAPDQLLLDPCEIRFRDGGSSFVVTPSNNPFGIPPLWSPIGSLVPAATQPSTTPAVEGK